MRKLFPVLLSMLVGAVTWAADKPAAAPPEAIKGKVLEVRNVDSYTYLRLKTKDGETWAAVGRTPVKKGSEVTIEHPMVMTNFESKSMKKTFDRIVLGSLADDDGADMAAAHSNLGKAAEVGDVRVPKASGPNAWTVAEIVSGREKLKNRSVLVRGKVVKFTPQVLGKNWVHLRDGSGSASDKTHDILVTTTDQAKIGDVVLAKGVVHTDKDLGSGYKYNVLIEEATLQK